jgi:hypothetical protein
LTRQEKHIQTQPYCQRQRVAGGGLDEEVAYSSTSEIKQVGTSCSPSGETLQKYKFVVTNLYESIISKLAPSGTGETAESALLERFRPFERHFVRERMLFMLSPMANKSEFQGEDWPKTHYNGFGAGLTEAQALTAISVLPHLLSLDPLDANRQKPNLAVMYQELKVPFLLIDQANVELDFWLIGTSPVDVAVFAFLYSLGITWDQCRILLSAFPFLVMSGLDPSWELCQTGPVRSVLREDSLLYLRMRLQLTCSEVFAMIKTHSRLSSYTVENLKVHLDALQSKLFFRSRELRQLVLRSPSLLGVSLSKVDERIDFLAREGEHCLIDFNLC